MKRFELSKTAAIIIIVIAGCLWGSSGLFVRQLNAVGMTSLPISVLRGLMTAAFMAVYILLTNPKLLKIKLRDIWCFIGTGVVSLLISNCFYFTTIETSGMGMAATLLYTSPVFVAVLSTFLFKEKFTWRTALAMALTFGGAFLASGFITGGGKLTPMGLLTGIGAGFFFALYSIFTRYALMRGYVSSTITLYSFLFTAVGGAFLLDYGEVAAVLTAYPLRAPLVMVIYTLVTTVFGYTMYNIGLTKVENSIASVVSALELVSAAVLGMLVFGEQPDVYSVFGLLAVLAAVVVVNLPHKKKRKE